MRAPLCAEAVPAIDSRKIESRRIAYSVGGLIVITTLAFAGLSAPVPALGSTAGCAEPVVVPLVAAAMLDGFSWSAAACADPEDCPDPLALPWLAAVTIAPSAEPCRLASTVAVEPVPSDRLAASAPRCAAAPKLGSMRAALPKARLASS